MGGEVRLTLRFPHRRFFLLAIVPTLGPACAADQPSADQQCSRLLSAGQARLEIVSTARTSAGTFEVGDEGIEMPASCRIIGVARPTSDSEIGFELWLPDRWTGRYSQLGNGGFAGNIDQPSLAAEIRRGNAVAMTDTGHKAGQFDASWALGHPEKVVDYGYRSIKATADAANLLIKTYYGRVPRYRYFIGCSNGGRQALMAAQRYPNDWDGILAGSPAVHWTKQLAVFAAIQHRIRASPDNWIPPRKLPAIQQAATGSCATASLAPWQCRLDASKLLCRQGDRPECLMVAQAATLELIQSRFAPTGAAVPDNWDRWILNRDPEEPGELALVTQAYRYMILDRPDWQIEQFDPEHDAQRASQRRLAGETLSTILDADSPDLSGFARHGGKLIMYLGWSDALISPAAGLNYYEAVTRRTGGVVPTQSFARLFVAPGMQHCQGGLAPNSFGQAWVAPALSADAGHDIRSALEAWVEHGRAPNSLIAAKYKDDRGGRWPTATQELRPYPGSAASIQLLAGGPPIGEKPLSR